MDHKEMSVLMLWNLWIEIKMLRINWWDFLHRCDIIIALKQVHLGFKHKRHENIHEFKVHNWAMHPQQLSGVHHSLLMEFLHNYHF